MDYKLALEAVSIWFVLSSWLAGILWAWNQLKRNWSYYEIFILLLTIFCLPIIVAVLTGLMVVMAGLVSSLVIETLYNSAKDLKKEIGKRE